MIRIGIDLGGTKIEGLALEADGRERLRRRRPTPRDDYDGTVEAIASLVEELEAELGARAPVGLATPGSVSPATSRMKGCNSTWLNGRALGEDVARRLGRAVRLANDADCFALSEAVDGAAVGARVVFGVIVGSGTGAGIVVDGRLLTGKNAIAGEWGHNPLPWADGAEERPGPRCWCGKHGCLETWLSGPGLSRAHQVFTGERHDAEEIARRAAAGDPACRATLDRYADRFARGLATIVNVLDPDAIVLGGGMSNLPHLYQALPRLLPPWVFSDRVDTRILAPLHGDSSGVRGAARLWPVVESSG